MRPRKLKTQWHSPWQRHRVSNQTGPVCDVPCHFGVFLISSRLKESSIRIHWHAYPKTAHQHGDGSMPLAALISGHLSDVWNAWGSHRPLRYHCRRCERASDMLPISPPVSPHFPKVFLQAHLTHYWRILVLQHTLPAPPPHSKRVAPDNCSHQLRANFLKM